jgi:hypothetical protein
VSRRRTPTHGNAPPNTTTNTIHNNNVGSNRSNCIDESRVARATASRSQRDQRNFPRRLRAWAYLLGAFGGAARTSFLS